jgi:hypothetical protein
MTIFPPAIVVLSKRKRPSKYLFAFTLIATEPYIPNNEQSPLKVKPN